jgi:SAM-dependent methyltransferase
MAGAIRFDDGAAYERYMGVFSRSVGADFLHWLAPTPGQRWLDVGCGNGAFTAVIQSHCAPAALAGIDPSTGQLDYARQQAALASVDFREAHAMALPFAADQFDEAVMPLVLFFVPEPARGVAEMQRVVAPGGRVSAYCWDLLGKGFPYELVRDAVTAMGMDVPLPPSADASRLEVMLALWEAAGLQQIHTRVIEVQRRFTDWADYWATLLCSPSVGPLLAALADVDRVHLQDTLRAGLNIDAQGGVLCGGRAHAIQGRVAKATEQTQPINTP